MWTKICTFSFQKTWKLKEISLIIKALMAEISQLKKGLKQTAVLKN